jgi:hypothetical protein
MLLAALAFAFRMQAALVEYTYTGKESDTGDGKQSTYAYSGLMIYDTVSSNITFVDWRSDKTFRVSVSTNFQYTTVTGSGAQNYVAITESSSATDTNGFYHLNDYLLTGFVNTLKIKDGTNLKFPRHFDGSNNRSLYPDANGKEWLSTSDESMNFAQTRTEADNNANLTSEEVESEQVIELEERGYTEE